jgi:sugar lactone lactonase YvrE
MKQRVLLLLTCTAMAHAQSAYQIQTLAGPTSRGDGGPAIGAIFDGPTALATDAEGNVYIAEPRAGMIRKVRAVDGVIERFAGTGKLEDGAEGRKASETPLMSPSAIFIDGNGVLYFADGGSCRIRQIASDGTIRNVAGTGRCAAPAGGGGGFPFPGGGFPGGGRERLALDTDLGKISGIGLDTSARLVFSEEDQHQVRRIDTDGFIRTLAGGGRASFGGDGGDATGSLLNSPSGVAFDSLGNLFIADGRNCRVRRIDSENIITTVAGTSTCASRSPNFIGGTPSRTAIGLLGGIARDPEADVFYVSAPGQARLLRLDMNASRVSTAIGNGTLGVPDFSRTPLSMIVNEPWGVAVGPGSRVYTSASTSFQVYRLADGVATLFAGRWPDASAPLRPAGSCRAADGALLIVDAGTEKILRRDPMTGALTVIAGASYPTGFTDGDGGPAVEAKIADPRRIFCAANGDVYLAHGAQVRVIEPSGRIRSVRSSVSEPTGVLLDSEGRLVFAEAGSHRILRYDFGARSTTVLAGTGTVGFSGDGGTATDAKLNTPSDIVFDSSGRLLISDRGNKRIRRLDLGSGKIDTVIGSSREYSYIDISGELANDIGLATVTGLASDDQGNVYVADGARLLLVRADGRVELMAGYAGEDDRGVPSYRIQALSGINGLTFDSTTGQLLVSVATDGSLLGFTVQR